MLSFAAVVVAVVFGAMAWLAVSVADRRRAQQVAVEAARRTRVPECPEGLPGSPISR